MWAKATLFEADFHSRTADMEVFSLRRRFQDWIISGFLTRAANHMTIATIVSHVLLLWIYLSLSLSLNRNLLIITQKCKRKDVFHCKWCSEYKIGQLDVSETERCVTELVTQFYVAPGYSHTFILFVEWSRRDCGGRHKKSMNGRYLLQQDWKRLGCSHLSTIHQ